MQALSLLHSSAAKAPLRVANAGGSSRLRHTRVAHGRDAFSTAAVRAALSSRAHVADVAALVAAAPLRPRHAAPAAPLERTRTSASAKSASTPKLEVPEVLNSTTKKMGLAIIAAGALAAALATAVAPLTAVGVGVVRAILPVTSESSPKQRPGPTSFCFWSTTPTHFTRQVDTFFFFERRHERTPNAACSPASIARPTSSSRARSSA